DIAAFLCFCQHVQYLKTDGLAYPSDYQGQITYFERIQHQLSQDNALLFGDGNVVEAFDRFPAEHVCKEWCAWFGLKAL
ncbi:hypothetical protein C8J56DRAFT_721713, partial [Mycena floridula]